MFLVQIYYSISIHTSREGCDSKNLRYPAKGRHFNPHIPWGMWPIDTLLVRYISTFQSTHPVRDVTTPAKDQQDSKNISIHTSREGCDSHSSKDSCSTNNFNPHIPWGMWLLYKGFFYHRIDFNPHIPWGMWRRTDTRSICGIGFQSTHPVRDVTWLSPQQS